MTGPPYPRYGPGAAPGQNAIGTFQIGLSPLGDVPPFDYWTTVISQYANSPILTAMIDAFNAAMDQTQNIDNFYDMIWNIQTAQGYGLDVWGRIVNVSRTLSFPSGSTQYLGFKEAGMSWTGFGQGSFFSGGVGTTTNVNLLDTDYRRLILAKAAGNISDGSIPSINAILLGLFPLRGTCYVADGLNMSLTYTFQFPLSTVELAIIQQSNVLPNPQGVIINVFQP
jgi:hypothetical protein